VSPAPILRCGRFDVVLDRPRIMGILNVTPDSFSDGNRFATPRLAAEHGVRLVAEGADLLDVGGESTRPGAAPVDVDEELRRVLPVVEMLSDLVHVPISVDTSKPEVMAAVVAAGASMINDVRALQAPGALEVVAALDVAVCLMHMQGTPATMQEDPHYDDVVADVVGFLGDRLAACHRAGIDEHRIAVDPGIGFGKTLDHNLALLRAIPELEALGRPVLIGVSRKGLIGALTGRSIAERTPGSVTAATLAAQRGAAIVRVHDVAATRDALAVLAAFTGGGQPTGRRD
jgi:dihydropteroate synthase